MLFADRIDRVAILAGGVLATVAMWAFGYLSHLPGVMLPGPATLAGFPVEVAAMIMDAFPRS